MPNNSSEGKCTMNYEDLENEFLQYASVVKLTEGQEMTGAEVIAAVTAIRAGVDVFKGVKDLNTRVVNLELDRAIHSMDRALFELEKELLAKDKENESLKKQIKQLKETPQILTRKGKFYYKEDDERPFCPVCYDSTEQKISLLVEESSGWASQYKCIACNATHLPYPLM